ncbi:hypothetical protein B0J17DRAFT_448943 [Rhizoctonia solani]|nr:hypothetical protein B0J17DRAFT_448943 [Rhizoctonia solani]
MVIHNQRRARCYHLIRPQPCRRLGVKEKLPQFFRVRDLIKRTQNTPTVATNSISSSGQTSPTRATTQNPQVRATTQAPQVIPTPQTPRHPTSGSLGESSTSATRPAAMQGTGHAANPGLNLSGPHSPATRNFAPQPQQHGGNIGFTYGMPSSVSQSTPHMTHASTQQQQQQQQQQQFQQQQQQFQQQQSQHHQAQQQRLQHSQHQGPHQLSIQHRPYASGSGVSGPASATAPSPSFQAPQSILTRSPALPPHPHRRPWQGHRLNVRRADMPERLLSHARPAGRLTLRLDTALRPLPRP